MLLMVALAALALSATAAFAAVTFDPATGKGFVGKGDVQIAYNLNNKQIQTALIANPQAFTFSGGRARPLVGLLLGREHGHLLGYL